MLIKKYICEEENNPDFAYHRKGGNQISLAKIEKLPPSSLNMYNIYQ